nr:PHD finger protein ALFIN-LIKE 4-like isoform X1 [Ipomoea batatas]
MEGAVGVGGGGGAAAGGGQYNPRTVEEVFKDFKGRRNGLIKALTTDVNDFYQQCDPGIAVVLTAKSSCVMKRLFNMINDMPTVFEVVTGAAKKQQKEKTSVSNHSSNKTKSNPKPDDGGYDDAVPIQFLCISHAR